MNCDESTKTIEHSKQMGGEEVLSRRNGLVVKIKHKTNLLELSTVNNGDLLAGLASPGATSLFLHR